ncbi:phosphatidylinositol N-acetylglucosaminyltransferase [Basidiobolus meristosporus CBS 931.73]|uniref:Phosphatidylinositol N-acetylglucosaminyltransferase n=1 Tax=Basidiobolus meristosporus CBS 931.73 TaxID=1314790 RepID=A0A1Y1XUQ7_9FUNG|nr:phosphatidylinositol N-acetylglucosaminyltransferase [Basidiobolus meristosporus CBS 931.73]|eukprot:ORX89480.1 phosphatidylinositol N-acetylglucosaminyltransferase [Basidiobolus meristosporus CBS 931.73]
MTESSIFKKSHFAKWQKLLYVKQEYPDNYVDSSFLEEMQKNANVRSYDYWTVVRESTVITQHISSIIIFVAVFIWLYHKVLSAQTLIWSGTLSTGVGYIYWDYSISKTDPLYQHKRLKTTKSAVLLFVALLGFSPILKTLTKDTSSDTIWAVTVCLFLVNMLLHDYGSGNRTNIKFPSSLSTNAAIFASVLLASRLPSNMEVFGLMSFAVEWFALFPIFRRHIKSLSSHSNIILSCVLFCSAAGLFYFISKALATFYIIAMGFITFGCPFWLIWIQKYKNEIHGPWDEARPKLQQSRS